jgi:ATP synthase F1 gamma subunit
MADLRAKGPRRRHRGQTQGHPRELKPILADEAPWPRSVPHPEIRALKNTRKITKAMKMIAFTRFRRAHKALNDSKAYGEEMGRLVSRLLPAAESAHPLTLPVARPSGKALVAAFTSERGLCGALNTNMLMALVPFLSERLAQGMEGGVGNFERTIDAFLTGVPWDQLLAGLRQVNVNPLEQPVKDLGY